MKIKPRRKFNAYYNFGRSHVFKNSALRELKRASCNGGNNSFTDVSIIRCSYHVALKNFRVFLISSLRGTDEN